MKRLFLSLAILAFWLNTASATIISYTTLSSDSGLSYSHLNNSFSTLYNDYNGSITTLNIQNNTLSDDDFATAVKPSNFLSETIGDYTYTGMLPPTSASLTSITTAGTSYVSGFRVVTDATSKTYTASKDTWVYIDKNGAFQYEEVANGAAQPTTPANSLLLAKVVTNGTAVTSVTDQRQTIPPNLRIYADLRSGLVISRDISAATSVRVGPGEMEFGAGSTLQRRRNTSGILIDFTTTGRNALDTGTLAAGNYYIFSLPDDTTTTNMDFIASTSSSDATGVTGEKLIGWVYANSTTSVSSDSTGAYLGKGMNPRNFVFRSMSEDLANTSTSFVLLNGSDTKFYATGERPVEIVFTAEFHMTHVSIAKGGFQLLVDDAVKNTIWTTAATDASGQINKIPVVLRWVGRTGEGFHTATVKWAVDAGTANLLDNTRFITVEEK